jgi:dethiobiotin synthetase
MNAAPKGFFVTGTDTGVGKTLVTVALTRALVARGKRTAVMKPVAAGRVKTPGGHFNDDALELLGASNVKAPYEDVNPYLLATPASPHLAARFDGIAIKHEKILAAFARLGAQSDLILVEGAGGWSAPISGTETMAQIAEKLALPVILVVGMRLGCLNHALLTREALRCHSMRFAGWVANTMSTEMALLDANIETLTSRFGMSPLAVVPSAPGSQRAGAKSTPAWADKLAERLLSP